MSLLANLLGTCNSKLDQITCHLLVASLQNGLLKSARRATLVNLKVGVGTTFFSKVSYYFQMASGGHMAYKPRAS
jgi:hypothetical protein